MGKKRRIKKGTIDSVEIWTEEEYEEYLKGLYGLEYIAGYTESGIPYGLPVENDDDKEIYNVNISDDPNDSDENLPF